MTLARKIIAENLRERFAPSHVYEDGNARAANSVSSAILPSMLRFSTAGSVDDGKSTLIGRLLQDTGNIYEDHQQALLKASQKHGDGKSVALALLTDGLKAEQEQGITIDVAYRYFSTAKRRFVLADSPGHEQYTRNMATGASTADLTIILVDAEKGVVTQTKRHAFIAALLGVPRLVVAINKMDLIGFSEARFNEIKDNFSEFASRLGVHEVRFIPVSALQGDNVVHNSTKMPWYHGESLLQYLEDVYIAGDQNMVDLRFAVQTVLRPNSQFRGYGGQILSGTLRVGDQIMALSSQRQSVIKEIFSVSSGNLRLVEHPEASAPMSVVVTLRDEIDIGRGEMLARPNNLPRQRTEFEAMVVWMAETPLVQTKSYLLRHTSREVKAIVRDLKYRIDVNTLHRIEAATLQMNEIGRLSFHTMKPIFADSYRDNRNTGSLILVDPDTNHTVAAGLIIDRNTSGVDLIEDHPRTGLKLVQPGNLHDERSLVSKEERIQRYGEIPKTLWLTGLSGSGKSTLGKGIERALFDKNLNVICLDGDNLRSGLNRDLGFSPADRSENIRRVAEVCQLMNEAGVVVVCCLISPLAKDRMMARQIIGQDRFIEIFVNASGKVCEERDPHGLYKKARAGQLKEFTGVSAPYEIPEAADLVLDTENESIALCLEKTLSFLDLAKNPDFK